MKKTKLNIFFVVFLAIVLISTFAFATTTNEVNATQTPVTTGENQTNPTLDPANPAASLEKHKGNYSEHATNIVLNKSIDGNAFLVGEDVTIKGQINGDLIVIADKVKIEKGAAIYGNVYTIAQDFTLNGLVYSLYAMSNNFNCLYDGMAALDLKVVANNITFSGYSERSLYFFASDSLKLTDDAYVLGNFTYYTDFAPTIAEKAAVYGDTTAKHLSTAMFTPSASDIVSNYFLSCLSLLGIVLIALLIVIFFKPSAIHSNVKFTFVKTLKAFAVGLIGLVLIPIMSIIFMLSVVSINFAMLLFAIYLILLALSTIILILTVATMLYNKLAKGKSENYIVAFTILVALLYYALQLIPYVGFIVIVLATIIGFGSSILWIFSIRKGKAIEPKTTEPVEAEDFSVIKTVEEPKADKKKDSVKDKKAKTVETKSAEVKDVEVKDVEVKEVKEDKKDDKENK